MCVRTFTDGRRMSEGTCYNRVTKMKKNETTFFPLRMMNNLEPYKRDKIGSHLSYPLKFSELVSLLSPALEDLNVRSALDFKANQTKKLTIPGARAPSFTRRRTVTHGNLR